MHRVAAEWPNLFVVWLQHAALFCRDVLINVQEDAMVRHEAAEALGSIADPFCIALLKQYSSDFEPIVADSCIVALDMLEYELSNNFQYAAGIDSDKPQKLNASHTNAVQGQTA